MTNWYVGKRIKEDVLYNQRAEYGKQVVKNLSLKLVERYGTGCIRSAETFSEQVGLRCGQKVRGDLSIMMLSG